MNYFFLNNTPVYPLQVRSQCLLLKFSPLPLFLFLKITAQIPGCFNHRFSHENSLRLNNTKGLEINTKDISGLPLRWIGHQIIKDHLGGIKNKVAWMKRGLGVGVGAHKLFQIIQLNLLVLSI